MSIETGYSHFQGPQFFQESREILHQERFQIHRLGGSTLASTLRKFSDLGMQFRGEYWLSHQSELLVQKSAQGDVAVSWRMLGLGRDDLDQDIELRDIRSRLTLPMSVQRGSLSDILEVMYAYYIKHEDFPPIIHAEPDSYIVSSTGSGKDLLALGGFLSEEGIDIKVFPDETEKTKYGTVPFVYPLDRGLW